MVVKLRFKREGGSCALGRRSLRGKLFGSRSLRDLHVVAREFVLKTPGTTLNLTVDFLRFQQRFVRHLMEVTCNGNQVDDLRIRIEQLTLIAYYRYVHIPTVLTLRQVLHDRRTRCCYYLPFGNHFAKITLLNCYVVTFAKLMGTYNVPVIFIICTHKNTKQNYVTLYPDLILLLFLLYLADSKNSFDAFIFYHLDFEFIIFGI